MRRRFRPLRFLMQLAAMAALVGLFGFGYIYVANTAFRQAVQGMWAGGDPKRAFGGRSAITLMVLGKDEDRDNRDQIMSTNARSDAILLARLDFDAKTIQILSIPRDTRVHIPGTRGYSKINAAHSIGGPELTAETIHDFLGVIPDASLVVDYKMLQHVIDQLGGVTVNVDKKLDYDDNWGNLHVHLNPGTQTLNGVDAMGFVRYRHANEGSADSDFTRIGRQQEMLQSVKGRMRDPATWMHVPGALEIVRKEMNGSLTYPQLVALATFARSVPKERTAMHVLPNRPGRIFVYAEPEASRTLVASLFPIDSEPRWMSGKRSDEGTPRTTRRRKKPAAPAEVRPLKPADTTSDDPTPPDPTVQTEPEVTVEPAPADTATDSVAPPTPTPAPEPKPDPDAAPH